MHLAHFKKLVQQVAALEKSGIVFDVTIAKDETWSKGSEMAVFEPLFYTINSLKQLAELQNLLRRPIPLSSGDRTKTMTLKINQQDVGKLNCLGNVADYWDIKAVKPKDPLHKTLKFFSNYITQYKSYHFNIAMIKTAPYEQIEDGVTYRYIGNSTECRFCIPHTDPLFNYLDFGHFLITLPNLPMQIAKTVPNMVITNELTIDTLLCLYALWLDNTGACAKLLPEHGFISSNTAKLTRIKLEKALAANGTANGIAGMYNDVRRYIIAEFEKSVNSGLIDKLLKKELPSGSFNGIKLTADSATYETVSIESPDLLAKLTKNLIFDERTDIYTIARQLITQQIDELESATLKPVVEAAPGVDAADLKVEHTEVERDLLINKIPIRLKRTSANTRRYVNGIMINKEEVEPVCSRATCFNTADEFNTFVKSVHTMSLKWHDVISNGLLVKIHDNMNNDEYAKPTAPLSAPRIRFKLTKEGDPVLCVNEKESVPIKLNKIMDRVATINRKTTNRYSQSSGYAMRNAAWARQELIAALKEACTYDLKTEVVDADGKSIKVGGKKTYTVTPVCGLTDAQAEFIEKMAREYQEKAITRSKLMLEKAIKDTGAKLEKFKGQDCYIVEGAMRKYAVDAKTNQVFNYDTQGYICIVESGHKVGVGADATVTRLYALKNDRMMVSQIGTLAHG